MILSRNWLNEFVDLPDISDKEFSEEMTLSGSKVETVERPIDKCKNIVVGQIVEMVRHENSDHMCDFCKAQMTQCVDSDEDGKCDVCGADYVAPEKNNTMVITLVVVCLLAVGGIAAIVIILKKRKK